MDGNRRQKIRNGLMIYLVFLLLLSCSVYALIKYENTVNRQQMVRLLASHPELEADIIFLWEKKEKHLALAENETDSMERAAKRLDELYGYELKNTVSDTAAGILLGTGILAAVLLAVLPGFMWWRRSREELQSKRYVRDLYECLEQFRTGRFEAALDLDYEEEPEEWMKMRESLRELGLYFADLKRQLAEEENSTKVLITDISHQLKTPLASLKMSHELSVSEELTTEEQKEFREQEEKEIEKLENLLGELVKLSRLETHMIQLKPVPGSIRQTIAAAVSRIYGKARKKNIEIQAEMDEDQRVCHDAAWTEEAVANVLDNAVKYSGEHTVISVRVTKLVRNVLIEIEDEGIGIRTEELTKIYQRFYRGKEAEQITREGAGVGLYLTRMILERQGGTISAKRKKGRGTVFRITLPLA